jgi:hypothetical protein
MRFMATLLSTQLTEQICQFRIAAVFDVIAYGTN